MKQETTVKRTVLLFNIVTISSLFFAVGCQIQSQPAGTGSCVQECTASSDCLLGQVCGTSGCCESYESSTNACEAGSPDCLTIDDICSELESGCNCEILANGDYQLPETTPVIATSGGTPLTLEARVSENNGNVLSNNGFSIFSDDPSCLSVEQNQITGAPYPCSTTIVAEFGKNTLCTAHILNLGDASPYNVRVFAYNEATGEPVPRATVIVDHDNDGISDTIVPTTSETGSTHFDLVTNTQASITVMAKDFHYVSFVGLTLEEGKTIHIPLTPITTTTEQAGVSGSIDFSAHRENMMNGLAESIQLALVAPSFPLRSLVQFDIDAILGGPMPAADCSDGQIKAGCYNLGIPGVTNEPVPLWGGMFFSFQASALKPFFEVRSTPGSRALWTLGGEWSYEEISPLAERIMDSPDCVTDLSLCLEDYRFTLAADLIRDWAPMMARLSFGSQSNLPLHPMSHQAWQDYISIPYGAERNIDGNRPLLDSAVGNRRSMQLNQPASNYTQINVPTLPMGPAGQPTDSLIALTGVAMKGSGFIPTGIAAGFDCYGDNCRTNREGHDRVLNAVTLCNQDDPASYELCREGIPTEQPAGSIGLFHASLDDTLIQHPQKTVIMALPLDVSYQQGLSATALILEGAIPEDSVSLEGVQFPQHPSTQVEPNTRSVSISDTGSSMTVITIYADRDNSNQPHWTIYGTGNSTQYTLPETIESFGDPLASDASSRFFRTSNIHLKSGRSLSESIFSADGLKGIFDQALGFATHHQAW